MGWRRQNINDILLTGLFLGIGLHGYTPFRIVPIFVAMGILIYLLHKPARDRRVQTLFALLLIVLVSVVVFLPCCVIGWLNRAPLVIGLFPA